MADRKDLEEMRNLLAKMSHNSEEITKRLEALAKASAPPAPPAPLMKRHFETHTT